MNSFFLLWKKFPTFSFLQKKKSFTFWWFLKKKSKNFVFLENISFFSQEHNLSNFVSANKKKFWVLSFPQFLSVFLPLHRATICWFLRPPLGGATDRGECVLVPSLRKDVGFWSVSRRLDGLRRPLRCEKLRKRTRLFWFGDCAALLERGVPGISLT